jgi:hypothetical protein
MQWKSSDQVWNKNQSLHIMMQNHNGLLHIIKHDIPKNKTSKMMDLSNQAKRARMAFSSIQAMMATSYGKMSNV